MGYLLAGAMKGAAGEYLKQSGEERQNKYQEMRDRRLAELQTTENVRAEGVAADQAKIERDWKAGESDADRAARAEVSAAEQRAATERTKLQNRYQSVSAGSALVDTDTDEVVHDQPKTFAPSAASTTASKWEEQKVHRMGADGKQGAATTFKDLTETWVKIAYKEEKGQDQFGQPTVVKVRDPSIGPLNEWLNQQVMPKDRLAINDEDMQKRDPELAWKTLQAMPEYKYPGGHEAAVERMKKKFWFWTEDMGGDPLDNPSTPSPDPKDKMNPAAGVGSQGYLSQADAVQGQAAEAAGATTADQGMIMESSQEIQAQIDALKGQLANEQGRFGSGVDQKSQQIQDMIRQYEMQLQRALEQEAAMQKPAGPAAAAGQRPGAPPTQVAMQ